MEQLKELMASPLGKFGDYALPFVLVLSVLVFVHEWGHYIVARICGVKIETFSIGFGKEILGWTDKRGTRWKISLIPLGGYVQMFGDSDPASSKAVEGVKEGDKIRPHTPEERKVAFYSQPVWRRAAIVFAGPAINFIFAVVILTGLFTIQGQPYAPAIAVSVKEGGPADVAGIKPDDKVIEVNGREVGSFQEMKQITMVSINQEMVVKVLRSTGKNQWAAEPITLTVMPRTVEEEDRFGFKHSFGRIDMYGPTKETDVRQHTLVSAVGAACKDVWRISVDTLRAIGQMVLGTRSKEELGGILRIGAYAGEFAKSGLVSLITFMALLSVNLGLINLLPIPMLDGGHLAFYAMESVKGGPVSERFQEYALRVGASFLIFVMVFATWNDLVQLKVVDYVLKLVS